MFIKLLESTELGMAFIDGHFHIHKMSNHTFLRTQGRELGSFFLNFKNMKRVYPERIPFMAWLIW
jgi:hypothetical protein